MHVMVILGTLQRQVVLMRSQVQARTICMQFEGNWTPIKDVVVDKVGKFAYVIGTPNDVAATPVIMDVSVDVRTKAGSFRCCRAPRSLAIKKQKPQPCKWVYWSVSRCIRGTFAKPPFER